MSVQTFFFFANLLLNVAVSINFVTHSSKCTLKKTGNSLIEETEVLFCGKTAVYVRLSIEGQIAS